MNKINETVKFVIVFTYQKVYLLFTIKQGKKALIYR